MGITSKGDYWREVTDFATDVECQVCDYSNHENLEINLARNYARKHMRQTGHETVVKRVVHETFTSTLNWTRVTQDKQED